MDNSARQVVDKMFEAFNNGDVEKIVETVSEDTFWTYHGTQIIPKGTFEKKDGVRKFFINILEKTEMIEFKIQEYIEQGNVVAVLGSEHQRVKRSGRAMKQKWVQIYTVKNCLIVKMEEFATSEELKQ